MKINNFQFGLLIIIPVLIASFFGCDSNYSSVKTNISEFERYLNAGDVSNIEVMMNDNLAHVSIKKESLTKPEHQIIQGTNFFGQENLKGPHYQFEIDSYELFDEKLEKARANGINFRIQFITVENRWLDTLIGFLLIIIIIGVWIFLKRRNSGGGAESQTKPSFNKSKGITLESETNDKSDSGINIISFLIPIIGIFIYATQKHQYPIKAKAALDSAISGIVIGVILGFISYTILLNQISSYNY
tara:strand:- start:2168 stop:2902 length:735 start_codon:yes stop_codon:yes gene_type:complete